MEEGNILPCLEDCSPLALDDPDSVALERSVLAKMVLRSRCMVTHDWLILSSIILLHGGISSLCFFKIVRLSSY